MRNSEYKAKVTKLLYLHYNNEHLHINWTPHGLTDYGLKYTKTSCILYLYYNNVHL